MNFKTDSAFIEPDLTTDSESDNMEQQVVWAEEATFQIVIPEFSKLKNSVLSAPCYVQNLPWKVMVIRSDASLGFFLQCNGESVSTTWSCYAMANLKIVAVRRNVESITRRIHHLFDSMENDWGFSYFMCWDYIADPANGYIMNDAVTFEVELYVEVPRGVSRIDQLTIQLAKERENMQEMRSYVAYLEKQNAELTAKINDLESEIILVHF